MHLLAVGRMRPGPEADLFARYNARLRPRLAVTEVPDAPGALAEAKRREGEALLRAVPAGASVIALDHAGAAPDSPGLARLLERWMVRPPAFVIGGAEGLHADVLARAGHVLSLGPLTWPHMLVRALLAEQLYRAQCILSGHPYHKASRP